MAQQMAQIDSLRAREQEAAEQERIRLCDEKLKRRLLQQQRGIPDRPLPKKIGPGKPVARPFQRNHIAPKASTTQGIWYLLALNVMLVSRAHQSD